MIFWSTICIGVSFTFAGLGDKAGIRGLRGDCQILLVIARSCDLLPTDSHWSANRSYRDVSCVTAFTWLMAWKLRPLVLAWQYDRDIICQVPGINEA